MATTLGISAKPPPERIREDPAADAGLEVEADDRDRFRDRPGVGDEFVVGGVPQGPEAEEAGVVARTFGGGRLRSEPAAWGRRGRRFGRGAVRALHLFGGESEDRFEEAEAGFADGELRGVDANREAADAGRDVVAAEGALATFVEPPLRRESQRMGGDGEAAAEVVRKSESSIVHFEVGRFADCGAAPLEPVRGGFDHFVDRDGGGAEEVVGAGGVPDPGGGAFGPGDPGFAAEGLAEASGERADGEFFEAGDVEREGGRLGVGQGLDGRGAQASPCQMTLT